MYFKENPRPANWAEIVPLNVFQQTLSLWVSFPVILLHKTSPKLDQNRNLEKKTRFLKNKKSAGQKRNSKLYTDHRGADLKGNHVQRGHCKCSCPIMLINKCTNTNCICVNEYNWISLVHVALGSGRVCKPSTPDPQILPLLYGERRYKKESKWAPDLDSDPFCNQKKGQPLFSLWRKIL